jgi:acetylxylan esterase
MDDAYCGGGDTNEGLTSTAIPISTAAQKMIAAAIFMGDPRYIPGLSYDVGTCEADGVSLYPSPIRSTFRSRHKALLTRHTVRSSPSWLQMSIRKQHPIIL